MAEEFLTLMADLDDESQRMELYQMKHKKEMKASCLAEIARALYTT